MTKPTTSVFYRVRGQGVRDHEWTKTAELPYHPPITPPKPVTPLPIPPSPQYSITPTVRIFPSSASAPSGAVTRPLVSPLVANPIPSASQPPRPPMATSMIARPSAETPPYVPPKPRQPNPTPESPPVPTANRDSRPQPPSRKGDASSMSPAQKAVSDKQTAALSSALGSLLRDRKRRISSSSKLPPLPKPIPKSNTQPSPALTSASAPAPSSQTRTAQPVKNTSNPAVGVKQEMVMQHNLDRRAQTDTAGSKQQGTPGIHREDGADESENSSHANSSLVKNTSQAVGTKASGPQDTTKGTPSGEKTGEIRTGKSTGKHGGDGGDIATEKRANEERGVVAVDKTTARGAIEGRAGEKGAAEKEIKVSGEVNEYEKHERARGISGEEKRVEQPNNQEAQSSRAIRLASDEGRMGTSEENGREMKRKKPSHDEDEERTSLVRSEIEMISFSGCMQVLVQVLSMCNTREGMNVEQMAVFRREARAIIESREEGDKGHDTDGRQKLASSRDEAPQQSKGISGPETVNKPVRQEAHAKSRGQTEKETDIIQSLSKEGEDTGSGQIDQRRERLEGVHADMFAPGASAWLADISKEYKNLAKTSSQLTDNAGNQKNPADDELMQHVSGLNARAEAMGFLTRMSNYFLTRVDAGSDGGPDASTLKTALNALKDVTQWIGWLVQGVNELSRRCRMLPREDGLVQQFATCMMELVSETSGQARNDGILAVLRDIKKAFPSSREFPGEGSDGKPYFRRRKRVGENVRNILPVFGKTCQWAQKIVTPDPTQAASAKDGDAKPAGIARRSSPPPLPRSDSELPTAARSNSEAPKQTENGSDIRGDVQVRKSQRVAEGNAKRPGPSSGSVGVVEPQIRAERGRESDIARNGASGTTELKIPRRTVKRADIPTSPKLAGSVNVTGTAVRTGVAPLRSAQAPVVDGRPRTSSGMTASAALVRERLASASNVERQRAQAERRQFGSGGRMGRGPGLLAGRDNVARARKRRKVTFANDDELVKGSAGTPHKKEELECLFTDGYDLLGCRNSLQQRAVQDRADQLHRGAMMALFGLLRTEFTRLRDEADSGAAVAPPEVVDLGLTPAAVRQVERMLPKPNPGKKSGGSDKNKKTM